MEYQRVWGGATRRNMVFAASARNQQQNRASTSSCRTGNRALSKADRLRNASGPGLLFCSPKLSVKRAAGGGEKNLRPARLLGGFRFRYDRSSSPAKGEIVAQSQAHDHSAHAHPHLPRHRGPLDYGPASALAIALYLAYVPAPA